MFTYAKLTDQQFYGALVTDYHVVELPGKAKAKALIQDFPYEWDDLMYPGNAFVYKGDFLKGLKHGNYLFVAWIVTCRDLGQLSGESTALVSCRCTNLGFMFFFRKNNPVDVIHTIHTVNTRLASEEDLTFDVPVFKKTTVLVKCKVDSCSMFSCSGCIQGELTRLDNTLVPYTCDCCSAVKTKYSQKPASYSGFLINPTTKEDATRKSLYATFIDNNLIATMVYHILVIHLPKALETNENEIKNLRAISYLFYNCMLFIPKPKSLGWYRERAGIFCASESPLVLGLAKHTTITQLLTQKLFFNMADKFRDVEKPFNYYSQFTKQKSEAIEFGNTHEIRAIRLFERDYHRTVFPISLCQKTIKYEDIQIPFGATPDGYITYPEIALIEVKCIFRSRFVSMSEWPPATAFIFNKPPNAVTDIPEHPNYIKPHYYAQIQMQLFCTNLDICYLIEYRKKEDYFNIKSHNRPMEALCIKRVKRDHKWLHNNLPKLAQFYKNNQQYYKRT